MISDKLNSLLYPGNVHSPLTGGIYSYNAESTNKEPKPKISDLLKPISGEEIEKLEADQKKKSEEIYQDAFKNHHKWWDFAIEMYPHYNDSYSTSVCVANIILMKLVTEYSIKTNTNMIQYISNKILDGLI